MFIKKFISEIFSSSQLTFFYLILIYTISTLNLYGLFLMLISILKVVISRLTKTRLYGLKISRRPKNAFNCNMFNSGGKSLSSGMPSGHMMNISILSFVFYNIYMKTSNKIWIITYLIIAITTYISRLYCHTHIQLIVGYIMGLILCIGIYYIDIELSKLSDRYNEDRSVFYNMFI